MWDWCARRGKPLLYASSAATYGDGRLGFSDAMSLEQLQELRPLNPYGWSKHIVDLRIARSVAAGAQQPPVWYGVKFFNVYGPHEHLKGDMRSVALKLYEKVTSGGHIELFRSHRPDFKDGMQLRDFIHVGDCIEVMAWLMAERPASGLYNIGTGSAEALPRRRQRGHRTDECTGAGAFHRHARRDPRPLPIFYRGRYQQASGCRL